MHLDLFSKLNGILCPWFGDHNHGELSEKCREGSRLAGAPKWAGEQWTVDSRVLPGTRLSEPSFFVWRREISQRDRERDSVAAGSSTHSAGLVAVGVAGQMNSRPLPIEFDLTTGVVIGLGEDVSAETLDRVLAAAGVHERPPGAFSDPANYPT